MAVTYTYPESVDLTTIAPNLIQTATLDDPILKYAFPIVKRNTAKVRWHIENNYTGLMALRGLDGEPTRVNRIGANELEAEPGYFGEFGTVTETEMTLRAGMMPTNINVPVSVDDIVANIQMQLSIRQANRIRQIAWTFALTGALGIPLPTGGTGGIGYTDTFTPQTFTPSVLWSVPATSTPLADLRSLQVSFGFGTSTSFGMGAIMLMNSATKNYQLGNTNASDLGGKRVEGGNTINDVPGINRIYAAQDLPQIMVWDDGYVDDSGTFQLYIPTGKVLVIGQRPNGEKPGEFQWTRNANNAGFAPGPYAFVKDLTSGPAQTVPPRIDVHQGFNGGAVIQRPTQMVVMTVG